MSQCQAVTQKQHWRWLCCCGNNNYTCNKTRPAAIIRRLAQNTVSDAISNNKETVQNNVKSDFYRANSNLNSAGIHKNDPDFSDAFRNLC